MCFTKTNIDFSELKPIWTKQKFRKFNNILEYCFFLNFLKVKRQKIINKNSLDMKGLHRGL